MKLILDNLGRIEHAEVEIRPLTVFVGENNTNKTWAAYCLYGLARYLTWRLSPPLGNKFGHGFLPVEPRGVVEAVDEAIGATLAAQPKGSSITQFQVHRRYLIGSGEEHMSFSFDRNRIRDLLRLPDDGTTEARAELAVSPQDVTSQESSVTLEVNRVQRSVGVNLATADTSLAYVWQANREEPEEKLNSYVTDVLRTLAFRVLAPGKIIVLPSERKALVTVYKMLTRDSEVVLPRPVLEYVELLKTIENVASTQEGNRILGAVDLLEGSILHGAVKFHGAAAGMNLTYFPEGGSALPMHAGSSLVRALAGLDVYLRHWASPGDLLIIDEPEMNAHPEAQVRITELLAYLVNKGVRIVLTTHSPYILDHLNNLIRARDLSESDQAEIAPRFKLGTTDCFLKANDVAAYLFKAETDGAPVVVTPAMDREDHRVDWETFGRTSDYVHNLYSAEIVPRLYRK